MARFNKLTYLQLLRGAPLTHSQYRVLVTILTYANPDGTNAHPGYAKLAGQCCMSKSSVGRCVRQLKEAGWLWETSPGRVSSHGGEAAVFELRIPPFVKTKGGVLTVPGECPDGTTRSAHIHEDPWGSIAV